MDRNSIEKCTSLICLIRAAKSIIKHYGFVMNNECRFQSKLVSYIVGHKHTSLDKHTSSLRNM